VQRALAVPGEDDRPACRLRGEEGIKGGEHITIGEIERPGRILTFQQEGAERRLAISWRPDVGNRIERAGLALDEQPSPRPGIAAGVERRVPAVALEIGGRVDVECRRRLGDLGRHHPVRNPPRWVAGQTGPGQPA
jgi:hypothetical protein